MLLLRVTHYRLLVRVFFFFFQAEDGIRDFHVTGVQTCALPILAVVPSVTRPGCPCTLTPMAVLVVQRGHVGRKTGATGAPGEQQFAIEAAERVAHHVNAVGHIVRIIDAVEPAERYRGDMFVAIHYASSSNPSARGASVGYQTPEGKSFAAAWKRHYQANGWTGGFRPDNYTHNLAGYYGVRRAVSVRNKRAFILEAGFHSNPDDRRLLASPAGPDRVGVAVAAAVVD